MQSRLSKDFEIDSTLKNSEENGKFNILQSL